MKIGKHNMDLHHRIFLLLLVVGLVSFAIAGAVFMAGMYAIGKDIDKTGALLGDNAATFTERFAENQVTMRLSSEADGKAQLIDREMEETLSDTRYLASTMTRILKKPQNYLHRSLPDARREVIASGKAYIHFSRDLAQRYGKSAFAGEIGLSANIADELEQMGEWYTAAFVGSSRGYLIAMDVTQDRSPKQFSREFLESYDPRKMNWYTLAAERGKPGFTGLYTDSNGNRCLTCVAPYYDASGLAGVAGIDCNPEAIVRLAKGGEEKDGKPFRHGFVLENATGSVIFSTFDNGPLAVPQQAVDLRQNTEASLAKAASAMADGQKGVLLVTVGGEDYYLAFAPVAGPGWSYGVLNRKSDVVYPAVYARENILSQMESFTDSLQDSIRSLLNRALLVLLLMLLALFFISSAIAQRFVQPILALVDGVKRIAQGNLEEKIRLGRDDELSYLADSVNDMADDLKEHMQSLSRVTAEKERIATELSVASDIQEGMLPRDFEELSRNRGFDLFAAMDAAKEVGGDFYDFYMLDDHRLAVTMADVSGKGVPAALFMVIAKTILKNSVMSAGAEEDLADVVRRANRQLCENNEEMLFVTVFFGVLDICTGEFKFVNCGHNPPLLRKGPDGGCEFLRPDKKNLVLGVEEEAVFTGETIRLTPGSVLFMYTDGVTEAMDEAGTVYSEARLKSALEDLPGGTDMSVAEILAAVRKDIDTHVGAAEQSDDITMLGLRYTGYKEVRQ